MKKRKGKEYDDGEILFEGEFLDDKRWNGKGKEFDGFNSLIFDGEFYFTIIFIIFIYFSISIN